MKKILLPALALCFAAGLGSCEDKKATTASGSDTSAMKDGGVLTEEAWVPVDSATAMKAMMENGTPGAEHAMLAKAAGTWDATVMWWMGEGAPAETSKGTETSKMVMGGKYLESTFKGDMMGAPFTGMALTGYDKAKKKWVNIWYDDMSTSPMLTEGDWNEATKTTTYTGEMMCAGTNRMCKFRNEYKMVDDNTHVMTMYGPDMKTGKEYKTMEITYKRKV